MNLSDQAQVFAREPRRAAAELGVAREIEGFDEADTKLIGQRRLLRRTDTKFVLADEKVASLLTNLRSTYAVVLSKGNPLAQYATLYFDTLDYRCFHDHRIDRRPRFKARIRHYDNRQVSYLEVKSKRDGNQSIKVRRTRAFRDDALSLSDRRFLTTNTPVNGSELSPTLWTNFSRITLLSLHGPERVTIDMNLDFVSGHKAIRLAGVAIVEVKQEAFSIQTTVMRQLQNRQIKSVSASKYCGALHALHALPLGDVCCPALSARTSL